MINAEKVRKIVNPEISMWTIKNKIKRNAKLHFVSVDIHGRISEKNKNILIKNGFKVGELKSLFSISWEL